MESGKRWFLRVQLFFDLINDIIIVILKNKDDFEQKLNVIYNFSKRKFGSTDMEMNFGKFISDGNILLS